MGDALELIFAENKVSNLHSGRATKRHQMVDIASNTILLDGIMGSTDIDSDKIK